MSGEKGKSKKAGKDPGLSDGKVCRDEEEMWSIIEDKGELSVRGE